MHDNLDIQLEKTMEAEALISNADMVLESSRLNRAEILAQSAMRSILHSRSFGQFILNFFSMRCCNPPGFSRYSVQTTGGLVPRRSCAVCAFHTTSTKRLQPPRIER